jgi:hypothetical protein
MESTLTTINTLISSDVGGDPGPSPTSQSQSPVLEFSSEEKERQDIKERDKILMPPPRPTSACVTASDLQIERDEEEGLCSLKFEMSRLLALLVESLANEFNVSFYCLSADSNTDDDEPEEIPEEDGELDLDGIDDDEINGYIMNTQEVKKKTAIWEKLNEDYILQQKGRKSNLKSNAI